jgi:GDPmannose 4,6-dehydratase
MLQQDQAEDYVIATGKQISVRDFVRMSANELGIKLQFTGQGADETATVASISGRDVSGINVGDTIIRVDPQYFRPAEVETLLGNPAKAKEKLGWQPEITVEEMCAEMVRHDLDIAKRHALLERNGHNVTIAVEG